MIANAQFGARGLALLPDLDSVVRNHTGAIPDPVVGVSTDPSALTVAAGLGESFYTQPGRVAVHEITYTVRPMIWRSPWNTGAHGVVRRLRPTIMDDRQTPILRPVRTLRSGPVAPWDAGTALGPTGHPTGGEE